MINSFFKIVGRMFKYAHFQAMKQVFDGLLVVLNIPRLLALLDKFRAFSSFCRGISQDLPNAWLKCLLDEDSLAFVRVQADL
jgi:hypothetical protein